MRIIPNETVGLFIDFQERLVPHMYGCDELIARTRMLLKGLKIIDIPILFTEQYPKGLGKTVDELREVAVKDDPFEKITFSCCDDTAIRLQLQSFGRKTVLIAGVEAHVCVLQTVLDIGDCGMTAVVVEDAVASRNDKDKQIALGRIVGEGGRITTVESVLFELVRTAQHASFKMVSDLIKA